MNTLHNACTVWHCSLHSQHITTNCLQDNNIVPTGILEVRHKLLQSCIVTLFKGPYVVSSCPFCQDDNQVLRQETDQLTTSSNQVLLLVGVPVSGILLSGHGNSHHMVPNTHRQYTLIRCSAQSHQVDYCIINAVISVKSSNTLEVHT